MRSVSLLLSAALTSTCGPRGPLVSIDLLTELPHAERRAAGPIDHAIRVDLVDVGGDAQPALVTDAPSRVIWPVRLPRAAALRTMVALVPDHTGATPQSVTIRVGMSDDRSYEEVLRRRVDPPGPGQAPAWTPVDVDLSEFSDWKWSLFYQPSRRAWKLVVNADATPGGAVAWARPTIIAK